MLNNFLVIYQDARHSMPHSNRASNVRAVGRGQIKHAEPITHKNLKLLNLMKNWSSALKK
jgi:hypothetical protein